MSGALPSSPPKAKPSATSNAQGGIQFEAAGQLDSRGLATLSIELFDEKFKATCDKGLNATLQRTRDGATAESRIAELAGTCTLDLPFTAMLQKCPLRLSTPCGSNHPPASALGLESLHLSHTCKHMLRCLCVRVCSSGEAAAAVADPDLRQEGPLCLAEPQV